jgi:tetratricopeptide (TPR) repeat protein
MVHDDPRAVVSVADELLDRPHDHRDLDAITARWARGMARRELGDLDAAADDLASARESAAGDPELAARIAVTESLVAFYRGRERDATRLLDLALVSLHGAERGRAMMQQAILHHRQGRLGPAGDRYHEALDVLEREGDLLAAARTHANLAALHAATNQPELAVGHARTAIDLGRELDQELLVAGAQHNLGYALARAGEVADALEAFAEAELALERLGNTLMLVALRADLAEVLLQANLLDDAVRQADLALVDAGRAGGVVHPGATGRRDRALRASRSAGTAGAGRAARASRRRRGAARRRPREPGDRRRGEAGRRRVDR